MFVSTLKRILVFSRIQKAVLLVLLDSLIIILAIFASFSLRLGVIFSPDPNLFLIIFGSPIIAIPIFIKFGLYRLILRFIGFSSLWIIVKAASLYALIWGILAFMFEINGIRSVVLINWFLVIVTLASFRILIRVIALEFIANKSKNIIIYGAGSAGRQLMYALKQSDEYKPISFIDDSNEINNKIIDGILVSNPKNISNLITINNVKEVLIAIPSLSDRRRKEIILFLDPYDVSVKSLPSVSKITDGKIKIEDLQKLSIEDLLGRTKIKPSESLLKTNITGKVVMVTGAGGSIGSELCRQIVLLNPEKLILLDISESALYQIDQELGAMLAENIQIYPIISSTRDKARLKIILRYYNVQTIYHAAAYKHVPLVEYNSSEGILNNVFGTLSLAQAAIDENVETFVLISTDKAVRPTNIMGASKRISELVLQALAKENHNTCFTMVRFGNVLDSSGSVIPLFKKQIKKGGPITLTDVNIVRYFMTIQESVELVIQAGAMSTGGDVFILDMGKPILIYDLAVKMIHLSGLKLKDKNTPDGDIEIIITGLRPGEKLYEELLVGLATRQTENELIMRAQEDHVDWKILKSQLNTLKDASEDCNHEKIRILLIKLVPEFEPKGSIVDFLYK